MRYFIRCRIKPEEKDELADSIKSASLARGKIFYEGMQTALRDATIDEDGSVNFIEVCYCLESGLNPMAMELPVLEKYFDNIKVKDARLRNQCTIECEFCDCTRNIKLPGKSLVQEELHIATAKEEEEEHNITRISFKDIGRIKLDRKKQRIGIQGPQELLKEYNNNNTSRHHHHMTHRDSKINNEERIILKPIFAGAAISGLFAIFYDGIDYFRIKNIPDTDESRNILQDIGFNSIYGSVDSIRTEAALNSLAQSDKRSNVV